MLETEDGRILKESLVILRYLDEVLEGPSLRRADPFEHAIESMLIAREGPFTMAGYLFVMNQDRNQRDAHNDKLLGLYRDIDGFLCEHNPEGTFLFEDFGLTEAVFTPMFKRFWFLDYYEGFALPDDPAFATHQEAVGLMGKVQLTAHTDVRRVPVLCNKVLHG